MTEVIVGVTTGVVAAWLVSILTFVLQKIVIPSYQNKIFNGFEVGGDWYGFKEENEIKYSYQLTVEQKGAQLTGSFAAVDRYPDRENSRTFAIDGHVFSNHIILAYRPISNRKWGGGTFIFQVFDGGDTLRGVQSYIKTKTGTVHAEESIVLKRKE